MRLGWDYHKILGLPRVIKEYHKIYNKEIICTNKGILWNMRLMRLICTLQCLYYTWVTSNESDWSISVDYIAAYPTLRFCSSYAHVQYSISQIHTIQKCGICAPYQPHITNSFPGGDPTMRFYYFSPYYCVIPAINPKYHCKACANLLLT